MSGILTAVCILLRHCSFFYQHQCFCSGISLQINNISFKCAYNSSIGTANQNCEDGLSLLSAMEIWRAYSMFFFKGVKCTLISHFLDKKWQFVLIFVQNQTKFAVRINWQVGFTSEFNIKMCALMSEQSISLNEFTQFRPLWSFRSVARVFAALTG